MENNSKLVRDILSSEEFQNYSVEEKQAVIRQIQGYGVSLEEINRIQNEILQIAKNTKIFEKMPYDVFVSIVRKGNIKEKDLIHFCNSSPKLREYCNRALRLRDGSVRSKQLFRLLLQDKGIAVSEDEDPEHIYITHLIGDKFRSFAIKITYMENANRKLGARHNRRQLFFPRDLYELLYSSGVGERLGFLFRAMPLSRREIDHEDYDNIVRLAIETSLAIHHMFRQYSHNIPFPIAITFENIIKYSGKDADSLIDNFIIHEPRSWYEYLKKFSIQDIENFLHHYEELYQRYLDYLDLSDGQKRKIILENFRVMKLQLSQNWVNYQATSDLTDESAEVIRYVKEILDHLELTEDDINYIIMLDRKIIEGILTIATPFKLEYLN